MASVAASLLVPAADMSLPGKRYEEDWRGKRKGLSAASMKWSMMMEFHNIRASPNRYPLEYADLES